MLLLTDNLDEIHVFHEKLGDTLNCEVIELDKALEHKPHHSMIACDVSLENEQSMELLRAALSHHRTDPRMPLLFLMRKYNDAVMHQSRQLGATETLPHDAPQSQLVLTIKRLHRAYLPTYTSRSEREATDATHDGNIVDASPQKSQHQAENKQQAEASIRQVYSALIDMRHAVSRKGPISIPALDQGADLVVTAIRRHKIRDWLEIVRRYDDITYQHCLLVAGLTAAFSLHLGLAPKSQHLLSQAALIHDIGKARIPYAILNKAGPLTPQEMELMKTHPAIGHEILLKQKGIAPEILDVVRHHHEYLDGSGYPDRLPAAQISDFVRLTTVCDIYAALIERRPYKAPMPPQQAFAILVDMGGKLDVSMVQAFQRVIRDT